METIKIAIADDHEMLRQSLTGLLNTLGYEVPIAVESGDKLLTEIKTVKNIPNVCILDINMPGKNTRTIIKEIKQNWPSVSVIVFSVNEEKTWKKLMLNAGADFYLRKNAHPQLLHEIIQYLVKH
ncbi:MAG TPA: response regulator transcription factor [Candidatus Babeliaceae bacterium]|nr:response regulator transcription factor [Candidatus Babeliaceae bacterium]